jgi:hypothetical protein
MYVWVKPRLGTHIKMWAEVSSSAPNLIHKGLLVNPITWRCLLSVLCPVRRPVTTQDCAVLKYKNLVFVVGLGPEISVWGCFWLLLRLHHITKCLLSTRFILLFMFCQETPKNSSGPTNFWNETSLASLSVFSFPHTSACPGTPYSPTTCRVETSFNAFSQCCTNGDVVLAA